MKGIFFKTVEEEEHRGCSLEEISMNVIQYYISPTVNTVCTNLQFTLSITAECGGFQLLLKW